MKKSIKNVENLKDVNNQSAEFQSEFIPVNDNQETENVDLAEESSDADSEGESNFSFSTIICYGFIIMLIIAIIYKFVFPTIDSIQANLSHQKIGKSIVSSYFNLLENTKYSDALKLLDTSNSQYSIESLISNLESELGSTNIVGYNVLDVIENQDSSTVNTMVSYVDKTGKVLKKDQSFLVKNTPQGWKITPNGLVKKFKLEPNIANFGNGFKISLQEIEYCTEGINLKLKIKNETYKKFNINGVIDMNMTTGYHFSQPINTVLKSRVSYEHNILFNGSNGEPNQVVIKILSPENQTRTLPVKIL